MLIVGIAGGTGSGKTTVTRKVIELLGDEKVIMIPQDSYYKDNRHLPLEERQKINFDHPGSIEFSLLNKHIDDLSDGNTIRMPRYSYITCTRDDVYIPVKPARVVVIEGILVLTNAELRNKMGIKVYVDADPDDRLARVIDRDIEERDRNIKTVLQRYYETVKPSHLQFIEPTKRYADIIIPRGGENEVAIEMLVSAIEKYLNT